MVIIYHEFPLKNCLKLSGHLGLRDMLERYLSPSSLPLSERVCSHALSSEDLSRGWDRSDRRRALRRRCRERSRRRSVPCAPSGRARARVCRGDARGGGGPAARRGSGLRPPLRFSSRPAEKPAVPSPVPALRRRPGDADGPGPGRAHHPVLEPSRPEPARALRGAPPSRGQATGFRSSPPPMKPSAEAGGEPPVPPRLSAFLLLLFLLLSIPALGPQPAGRRGQTSRAGAGGPFLLHFPGGWGDAEAMPRAAVSYRRPGMKAQAGERVSCPLCPLPVGQDPSYTSSHSILPQRIPPHPRPAQPASARRGLFSLQAEEPGILGGLK